MTSSATEIAGLYGKEGRIEKPSDGMSAYITYTRCMLFRKLKTIAKTVALNNRGCSGMLGRTCPLLRRSRGCGLGVVKEQVDGWG